MNIMVSVCVKISLKDTIVYQNMKVLDSKSYKNVLLGRDFLLQFHTV